MFGFRDDGLLRGGFWRRIIAWCVDMTIVILLLQIGGIVGYALTDGRIQASSGFGSVLCVGRAEPPAGLPIPESFRVDFVTECTTSLFGATHSKVAKVGRRTRVENIRREESVDARLDAAGRYVSTLDLSIFILPLFAAMRIFFERGGGRTFGRRLTGLRLISRDDVILEGRRLGFRYAWMFAPLAPGVVFAAWAKTQPPFGLWERLDLSQFFETWAMIVAPTVLAVVWAAIDMARRRDAYYDRLVGGAVVRD